MIKTIYLNLDDDATKVANMVKRTDADELVLVFPKKSFIFSDSINLRLLKKQVDMLGKKVFILTMDEKGQMYAKEAGFELKFFPRTSHVGAFSDIRQGTTKRITPPIMPVEEDIVDTTPKPVMRKVLRKVTKTRVSKAAPVIVPSDVAKPRVAASGPHVNRAAPVSVNDNLYIPPAKEKVKVNQKPSFRKYVVGFIALTMIVVLVLVLVVLPSATIEVYAKSQVVSRDIDIIADVNAQAIDAAKLTIPATAINETQSISNNFQTLGKKEVGSKAQGRIAIYNLTGSPITLRAGTTTLTAGSKSYAFNVDQNLIRAVADQNDVNPPVADIVAIEGGEGSNLPAGTRLEITNQAFGNQPQRLFAKTVTQVIGGASRFVSIITPEEIQLSQKELAKKVIEDVNKKLREDNRMIVDGAYTATMNSFTTDKPENTESPSFNAQGQVSITGLAVSERELKQMVRQRLLLSLGTAKVLQDESIDTVTYKTKNIDTDNGVMQLSLHYESAAVPAIDVDNLKVQIAGKSKAEASELILANPDVDKIEITVQPAWQSSLPRFVGKIRLEMKQ